MGLALLRLRVSGDDWSFPADDKVLSPAARSLSMVERMVCFLGDVDLESV